MMGMKEQEIHERFGTDSILERCPACNGLGNCENEFQGCEFCNGTGLVAEEAAQQIADEINEFVDLIVDRWEEQDRIASRQILHIAEQYS